jgi:beta-glucosidase
LAAGQLQTIEVKLDKYALSYWCTVEKRWKIESGIHTLFVGTSSVDLPLMAGVLVEKQTYWDGI